jgi:hypothetical protein
MATIVLPAEKVIAAAEATIANIEKVRKERDEENITNWMKPRKVLWFTLRARTREEAIKALDHSDSWGWRSQYAWGDLKHAKKLLRLARLGDPVTLNEDDVRVLF